MAHGPSRVGRHAGVVAAVFGGEGLEDERRGEGGDEDGPDAVRGRRQEGVLAILNPLDLDRGVAFCDRAQDVEALAGLQGLGEGERLDEGADWNGKICKIRLVVGRRNQVCVTWQVPSVLWPLLNY